MANSRLAHAVITGAVSGYVGTNVMDAVTTRLQEMESDQDRQREKRASRGVAFDVAAEKMAGVAGVTLSDRQVKFGGTLLHYGLGFTAGETYVLLRRGTSLNPAVAGMLTGLSIWAVVDEGINPYFGFSAPSSQYPTATHVRGLLGHLALGLATAVSAELLAWRGSR